MQITPLPDKGNSGMYWILMPFRRYFVTHGRSRRMEYWSFQLTWAVVFVAIIIFGEAFSPATQESGRSEPHWAAISMLVFWLLGTIIPSFTLTVRRWHDLGHTGWLFLVFGMLSLIPLIGLIFLLWNTIWFFMPGVVGENKWGPDPKE